MPAIDDYISTAEAAERLDYTVQHVRRLLREGALDGAKVGRDWVVTEESVAHFASRRENFALQLEADPGKQSR